MTGAGLPHSDTLGSQLGWQLPEAYRSLPRPSSAPDAKTSTACPYTLTTTQPKTITMQQKHQDARVHYALLKEQPPPPPKPRPTQAGQDPDSSHTRDNTP